MNIQIANSTSFKSTPLLNQKNKREFIKLLEEGKNIDDIKKIYGKTTRWVTFRLGRYNLTDIYNQNMRNAINEQNTTSVNVIAKNFNISGVRASFWVKNAFGQTMRSMKQQKVCRLLMKDLPLQDISNMTGKCASIIRSFCTQIGYHLHESKAFNKQDTANRIIEGLAQNKTKAEIAIETGLDIQTVGKYILSGIKYKDTETFMDEQKSKLVGYLARSGMDTAEISSYLDISEPETKQYLEIYSNINKSKRSL